MRTQSVATFLCSRRFATFGLTQAVRTLSKTRPPLRTNSNILVGTLPAGAAEPLSLGAWAAAYVSSEAVST